jgi:hypothetical protein
MDFSSVANQVVESRQKCATLVVIKFLVPLRLCGMLA